jgi:hypothetical protein
MFPLVSPRSRIFRTPSKNSYSYKFSLVLGLLLIALVAITSACSSLNAGAPAATSKPAQWLPNPFVNRNRV